jgi:hypothetical protein
MSVKRGLKATILRIKCLLEEEPSEVPFDNTYPWLGYIFHQTMKEPGCSCKPMYIWGVVQGAALGKILAMDRVSVIEFGVAGGMGLLLLQCIAEFVESNLDIGIDVYGFDTGTGLPKPQDYRDQPNMWFEGQLPMKKEQLQSHLRRASLKLGLVKDTVPAFLEETPAPVAFVSFDLDIYSSTRDALAIFEAQPERLLPRVICYFDDIIGHTYSDYTGERLAISEFNCMHTMRKLSPVHGLRYFVPGRYSRDFYWDLFYFAHFFDHPLYNKPDSIRKAVFADYQGNTYRRPINSDWRCELLAE